ncbi:MAG: sterile alpha motif-like domain-containing protein [Desulfovibrionaceae bacterium]|nr:sterile alpha motif-like domain-containing protein [Desulfovibrionaceae bacterium]
MTFYTYMLRNHLKERGPKGDLARDMKDDADSFPRNTKGKLDDWYTIIENYLWSQGACYECMRVFEESWKEYAQYERMRRNQPNRNRVRG